MKGSTATAVALLAVLAVAVPAGGAHVSPSAGSNDATTGSTDTPVTLTVKLQTPDGEPIGGANVTVAYEDTSKTTRSFSNGNALVDVPEDAEVTIHVDHPEYIINHNVSHDLSESDNLTITMYRRGIAVLEVRSDDDSPTKVQNARVEFRKAGHDRDAATGYTGSNGIYQTPSIESGAYRVTVRKRGYLVKTSTVNVTPSNPGAVIALTEANAEVSVTVRDDHFSNPQPVEGATVRILYQGDPQIEGTTQESGKRALPVGVNGQYTLQVTKDGYEQVERSFFLGEEDQSFSVTISRNPSLSIDVVSDRVISGENTELTVTNAYGDRVEGVTIRRNGTTVGQTDADGELTVDIPSPGPFEFVATKGEVTSDPVRIQGYDPATASPTPTETRTPTETTTTQSQSGPLPGFTPIVALLGVLGAIAVIALRRRR